MRCEEVRENLVAWLDGELEASTSARIDQHVESCRECATELVALRTIRGEIRRVLSERPPFDVAQALRGVLDTLERDERVDPSPTNERFERSSGRPLRGLASTRETSGPPAGATSTRSSTDGKRSAARPGWRKASGWLVGVAMAAGLVLAARMGLDRGSPWSAPASRPGSVVAAAPATAPAVRSAQAPTGPAEREPKRDAVAQAPDAARSREAVVAAADPPDGGGDDLGVPEEVLRRPGMFLDIPIVRRLEKLRSLEAVYHQSDEGSG